MIVRTGPHGVPLPPELAMDVGEPLGLCKEEGEGVFTREWSKVKVSLDCGKFVGSITPKTMPSKVPQENDLAQENQNRAP